MCSVVVVLPASMCAMIPILRSLARSYFAMAASKKNKPQSTQRPQSGSSVVSVCSVCSVVGSILPGEVCEGLVGLGHLDGVFALGHGLAFATVRGHELVRQAQIHRPPGLGTRRL